MTSEHVPRFNQINNFFLEVALLALLLVGLWKVVRPEVLEVIRDLKDISRPNAAEQSKVTRDGTKVFTNSSPAGKRRRQQSARFKLRARHERRKISFREGSKRIGS